MNEAEQAARSRPKLASPIVRRHHVRPCYSRPARIASAGNVHRAAHRRDLHRLFRHLRPSRRCRPSRSRLLAHALRAAGPRRLDGAGAAQARGRKDRQWRLHRRRAGRPDLRHRRHALQCRARPHDDRQCLAARQSLARRRRARRLASARRQAFAAHSRRVDAGGRRRHPAGSAEIHRCRAGHRQPLRRRPRVRRRPVLCRLYPGGAPRPRPLRRRLCQPRLQRDLRRILPRRRADARRADHSGEPAGLACGRGTRPRLARARPGPDHALARQLWRRCRLARHGLAGAGQRARRLGTLRRATDPGPGLRRRRDSRRCAAGPTRLCSTLRLRS